MEEFIQRLPKAEMHLHLEGTIPWEITHPYSPWQLQGEAPPWLHPDYRFADFNDFGEIMRPGINYMRASAEMYGKVAHDYFQQLIAQNVRYVEVSIGMGLVVLSGGLNPTEVVASIYAAAPPGLHVRVIAGVNRRFAHPLDGAEAQAIIHTPGVVGIDLHSDERENGPKNFAALYQAASERGYLLRAHAGELTGAQTIWDTIQYLNVTRIEHGTTAIEDDSLILWLAQNPHITLDMCPTSNVKLGVVKSYADHPIKKLMQRGVSVTCSTDDPAIFNTTLTDELHYLVQHLDFTRQELATLQINAFKAALLPDDVRQALIDEVMTLI